MKYRILKQTDLQLSELGFGVWGVSTNWWGHVGEVEAVRLLQRADHLGINFFDTADAYGAGYGEQILSKALGKRRHQLVFGTKFGYDLSVQRQPREHKERPQNWSPKFVRQACEDSLRRLKTDYIDLYQLHNARLTAIADYELFETLAELKKEGKIRYSAVAVGPDIGWMEEGEYTIATRKIPAQIIYNILEQDPADELIALASEHDVGLLTRVPHASGMLDGTYTKDTNSADFPSDPEDHRAFRKMEWLKESIAKLKLIDFLFSDNDATVGQIAIKFCLKPIQVASVLPTITTQEQLVEYAAAPEIDPIPDDHLTALTQLYGDNFGFGDKPPLKSSVVKP